MCISNSIFFFLIFTLAFKELKSWKCLHIWSFGASLKLLWDLGKSKKKKNVFVLWSYDKNCLQFFVHVIFFGMKASRRKYIWRRYKGYILEILIIKICKLWYISENLSILINQSRYKWLFSGQISSWVFTHTELSFFLNLFSPVFSHSLLLGLCCEACLGFSAPEFSPRWAALKTMAPWIINIYHPHILPWIILQNRMRFCQ